MSTKDLVNAALERGVQSLALTNINSTCDLWDFVQACNHENIKPIVGVEIRNDDKLLYILLAASNRGLKWINDFVSVHLMEKKKFPELAVEQHFFELLSDGFVIYPFAGKPLESLFEKNSDRCS